MTLQVSSVLQDASKTTIQDTTTYTTPARSEYYSQFYAYKVDVDNLESALAVTSQGTPTSQATWEVTTPTDGHHRFKLLLYWVWEGATSFSIGDIVERNGSFYIANTANSGDDPENLSNWDLHTASVEDEDVANVITTTLDCVLFYRLKTCFAREVAHAASVACECDDDKKPVEIQKYERLGVLIDGIAVDNYQQRFNDGEQKVRYMAKLCPNCN
jgi:hypothetical protein